jgi:hypothetical protein
VDEHRLDQSVAVIHHLLSNHPKVSVSRDEYLCFKAYRIKNKVNFFTSADDFYAMFYVAFFFQILKF